MLKRMFRNCNYRSSRARVACLYLHINLYKPYEFENEVLKEILYSQDGFNKSFSCRLFKKGM